MTYWKPRNKDEDEKDETPLLSKSGSEIHSSFKSSKWFGIFLAAASGLLLTLYSALYKSIKTDIDNSTILVLRGLIQVSVMAVILGVNLTQP
jgi:drug/metabolite transporter (DMT)-like permease